MVRIGVLLGLWLGMACGFAQPASGRYPGLLWGYGEVQEISSPDLVKLHLEDSLDMELGNPPRFGIHIQTNQEIKWNLEKQLNPGFRLRSWSFRLPGAKAIGVNLKTFKLTPDARFWASNGKQFQGEFFANHVNTEGGMATFPLTGDSITIFIEDRVSSEFVSDVEIGELVFVYRFWDSEKNGFGSSGNCNIDIACPEAAGWDNQGRAVALLLTAGNTRFCSGTMIRNTGTADEPLLLTARHCPVTANSQFVFRYVSPECNGSDGSVNRVIQGCQILASRVETDFALLRLNGIPAPDWNVYRAGWDRSDEIPDSSVCLHHPQGDVLKFSKDRDSPTKSSYLSQSGNPEYWRIGQWELGTTQGGSSGSALFSTEGQIIGQLRGGFASCSNLAADYYGRFAPSWEGSLPNQRLHDWLDPVGLGVEKLDGEEFTAPAFQRDVSLNGWEGAESVYCSGPKISVRLRNHGSEAVQQVGLSLYLNGVKVAEPDTQLLIFFFQEAVWPLDNYLSEENGDYTITAIVRNVNGSSDEFAENDTLRFSYSIRPYRPYRFTLRTDNFPWETSWEIRDQRNDLIYSDPLPEAISDTLNYSLCLADGCYTFRIEDSAGDGICCAFGNGFFRMHDEMGNSVFSGGEFGELMEQRFCVPAPDSSDKTLALFPNPNNGGFSVFVPEELLESETYIGFYDYSGRKIHDELVTTWGWLHVNLPGSYSGLHIMRVWNTSGSRRYGKFVVVR
jgi:lysyl endopeptidase